MNIAINPRYAHIRDPHARRAAEFRDGFAALPVDRQKAITDYAKREKCSMYVAASVVCSRPAA